MTKTALENHLGKYVRIIMFNGEMYFGILHRAQEAENICNPRLYTLVQKNGEMIRLRSSDVKKCSEDKKIEQKRKD